jgi:hypothetical protein
MIGTFEVLNGTTKLTFEVTANTTLVIDVVGDAAEYLWNQDYGDHRTIDDPITFEDLSNQEKLDLVADHVQRVILNLANSFKSEQAQEQARENEKANEYRF